MQQRCTNSISKAGHAVSRGHITASTVMSQKDCAESSAVTRMEAHRDQSPKHSSCRTTTSRVFMYFSQGGADILQRPALGLTQEGCTYAREFHCSDADSIYKLRGQAGSPCACHAKVVPERVAEKHSNPMPYVVMGCQIAPLNFCDEITPTVPWTLVYSDHRDRHLPGR